MYSITRSINSKVKFFLSIKKWPWWHHSDLTKLLLTLQSAVQLSSAPPYEWTDLVCKYDDMYSSLIHCFVPGYFNPTWITIPYNLYCRSLWCLQRWNTFSNLCHCSPGEDERGGGGPGGCCDQQSAQHASSDLLVRVPPGRQPAGETPAEVKPRSAQRYLWLTL